MKKFELRKKLNLPMSLTIRKRMIQDKLEKVIYTKNEKLLEEIFYSLNEENLANYLETMNLLLLEDWHSFYYDIVLELQRLKSSQSIEPLYQYLIQNQESDLADRVVWALADIGTDKAKEKFVRLLRYSDVKVKELIAKRLEQWENERWRKEMKPLGEREYLTDEENDPYTKELYIELAEGHKLYGQPLRVIIHQDRINDDVVCKHLDRENYYSIVHLTWSQRAEHEDYPSYETGLSWEQCCLP